VKNNSDLILRSAFWRVSKDGRESVPCVHPSRRAQERAPQDEAGKISQPLSLSSGLPACLAAGNCPKIIKSDREIEFAPAATPIARSWLIPCGPAAGWRVRLLRRTCREGGGLA